MDLNNPQINVEKQKELQKMLMDIEVYKKQTEEISKQAHMVDAARMELLASLSTIESLDDIGGDSRVLIPLGSDCFVHASLKDVGKVIIGVGAQVSVEDDLTGASTILKDRMLRMEETGKKLHAALVEANNRLVDLDMRSKSLLRELQM